MANDYYDFNPSPAVWALLLTGMVLFVLAISALLIVQVANGEATGPIVREVEPMAGGSARGRARGASSRRPSGGQGILRRPGQGATTVTMVATGYGRSAHERTRRESNCAPLQVPTPFGSTRCGIVPSAPVGPPGRATGCGAVW